MIDSLKNPKKQQIHIEKLFVLIKGQKGKTIPSKT